MRPLGALHAEHAEARLRNRLPRRQAETEGETHAGVGRVDDTIVPEPRRGVIRIALQLVLFADRRLESGFFFGAPCTALRLDGVAAHRREHVGSLLTSHDADARVRPGPQETRRVRAATHAVIARA